MKKSLFFGFPVALALAALLAGCPQAADDDGETAAKPVNTPGTDLSHIAHAFGYGIDTVQVVSDIQLGSNELVVPAGKKLDLQTNGRSIRGITANSKIIVQDTGDILFSNEQAALDFAPNKGAKIIAGKEFINKYVHVDYTADEGYSWTIPADERPGVAEKENAIIYARWQQIVVIDTFDNFKNYGVDGKLGYIFIDETAKAANTYKYVAVSPSAPITGADVRLINARAAGLRLYLVGEPVEFNFNGLDYLLDLSGSVNIDDYYTRWAPVFTGSLFTGGGGTPDYSLFNVNGDSDGSLTVAGNILVPRGLVNAPGGFTVWGGIDNTGATGDSTDITTAATPVTAWTAFLYGSSFGGSVKLRGSVPNVFGGPATFEGNVEIDGPSTFNSTTASFKGDAVFTGDVVFGSLDSSSNVSFAKNVTFAGNAQFSSVTPTFSGTTNLFYKEISGLPYSVIKASLKAAGGSNSKVKITDPTVKDTEYDDNVVFDGDSVEVGTQATFVKDVTFEGDATFNERVTFGAGIVGGSETTSVVIKGLATFTKGADFGTLGANGQNVVYIEEASFAGGSITGITTLNLGDAANPAVVISTGTEGAAGAGTAGINIVGADSKIEYKDNALIFTGKGGTITATIALNDTKLQLNDDSSLNLGSYDSSGFAFSVAKSEGGEGYVDITGNAVLGDGKITGKGSSPAAVKAVGSLTLTVPPVISGGPNPVLGVNNAVLDIREGGSILFAGTLSRIVFTNGGDLLTTQGYALGTGVSTGVIIASSNAGGSASLVVGSAGTTQVGTRAGTDAAYVGMEGIQAPYANLLTGADGFVVVKISAFAGSESAYKEGLDPASNNSIAVFTSEGWTQ